MRRKPAREWLQQFTREGDFDGGRDQRGRDDKSSSDMDLSGVRGSWPGRKAALQAPEPDTGPGAIRLRRASDLDGSADIPLRSISSDTAFRIPSKPVRGSILVSAPCGCRLISTGRAARSRGRKKIGEGDNSLLKRESP
jgi:hypothetical protein